MSEKVNRWLPVLGGLWVVTIVTLQLFGHGEAARMADGVGSALGVTAASPIPFDEVLSIGGKLAADLALGYGLVRKLVAHMPQPPLG